MVRAIREIAQVHKRLAAIKAEIEELANGELSRLMKQVEEAATGGRTCLPRSPGKSTRELKRRKHDSKRFPNGGTPMNADSDPTSRSISVRRCRGIASRQSNSLVARFKDIAELGTPKLIS